MASLPTLDTPLPTLTLDTDRAWGLAVAASAICAQPRDVATRQRRRALSR